MNNEKHRLDTASNWYIEEQLEFDKRLIRGRYENLKPYFTGQSALELGCAEGQMTQFLLNDFESLTVVDSANDLLMQIKEAPNLIKVNSLFEDFRPDEKFDTVILEHILEHVANPVSLLETVSQWVSPNGRILLGVPNANSIHRLAAVKMGLLEHQTDLNNRDIALGHRRVYTSDTLSVDIQQAGLKIENIGGVFLKVLSNQQIQDHWSEEMITGFYKLGEDFPFLCADLFAICSVQ